MDIKKLVQEYLDFCQEQKRLSLMTIKSYRIDLSQFLESKSGTTDPLSKEYLNRYCRFLNTKYMPRTVKRKVASLHAFCRWLEFEEVIDMNPFAKVHVKVQQIKQIPKYLTLYDMEKILRMAYAKCSTASRKTQAYGVCIRNAAILELLFATGLRVSELCALKRENFQVLPGTIRVLGKGNKERIIPIENPEVLSILQKQIALSHNDASGQDSYLFYNQRGNPISQQSVRNMVAKYANEAGISGRVTPHMIRHTFATLMLEQNVDIRYIQNLLGHSSIRTTEIYTTVTQSKERQLIAERHPRNSFNFLQVNTTLSPKSQV